MIPPPFVSSVISSRSAALACRPAMAFSMSATGKWAMMVTLMTETSPRMARPPQQRWSGQVTTFLACGLCGRVASGYKEPLGERLALALSRGWPRTLLTILVGSFRLVVELGLANG